MEEIFKYMKFIFDIFVSPLSLPIAWYWDYLIIWAISGIAYRGAFASVGKLYDSRLISGSFLGSLCHWLIRFVFFVAIWAIVYATIVAVNWVIANYILVLSIIGGLLALSLCSLMLLKMR